MFYALKIYRKLKNEEFVFFEENILEYKQIGLLGKECRFIVQTLATFQNNVSAIF